MVVNDDVLSKVERQGASAFDGEVYRHTIGTNGPEVENRRGARWNPPGVAAIYTSLERVTAIAEGDYMLSLQKPPPRVRRLVHRIRVELGQVVDLRSPGALDEVGIDENELRSDDHWACRRIGEAVHHLGLDGLLVPSARADGSNLVILPRGNPGIQRFEVLGFEVIDEGL